jgi:hypothetical protein
MVPKYYLDEQGLIAINILNNNVLSALFCHNAIDCKIYLNIAFSQEMFSALVLDKTKDKKSVVKIQDLIVPSMRLKLAINRYSLLTRVVFGISSSRNFWLAKILRILTNKIFL